jgi:phospho-N-acetylmuramoyl-pentapeptide-transferase
MDHNMTEGREGQAIFRFALPLIGASVLQTMYSFVDSVIVGNFVGETAFGAIGLLDDWKKIKRMQNTGLSTRAKFLLQLAAALLFIFTMKQLGFLHNHLYLPWSGKVIPVPAWLFDIFAVFVTVGTVNAVNISDGVDGLAAGTSIPTFLFFVLITFAWGREYLRLGFFASGIVGGLMGFLVYNFNPCITTSKFHLVAFFINKYCE